MIGLSENYSGPCAPAYYNVGTVVRHRLYHYSGVILAMDPHCRAGEAWYLKNATQPDREQPWYHVLVIGSDGVCTYAAGSNLVADPAALPWADQRTAQSARTSGSLR